MRAWTILAASGLVAACSSTARPPLPGAARGRPRARGSRRRAPPGCAPCGPSARSISLRSRPPRAPLPSPRRPTDEEASPSGRCRARGARWRWRSPTTARSGPAVTLAPPAPGDAGAAPALLQVEAAPGGTWVTTLGRRRRGRRLAAPPPSRRAGRRHADVSLALSRESDDSALCAVGQDDSIGCAGGNDVGWYLPGQTTPTVVGDGLDGASGVWSNGLFTFGDASAPGIESIASDGSFADFPAAAVLADRRRPRPRRGRDERHGPHRLGGPAVVAVFEVASTATPPQTFSFGPPGAYLMTAVPRAASNGALTALGDERQRAGVGLDGLVRRGRAERRHRSHHRARDASSSPSRASSSGIERRQRAGRGGMERGDPLGQRRDLLRELSRAQYERGTLVHGRGTLGKGRGRLCYRTPR